MSTPYTTSYGHHQWKTRLCQYKVIFPTLCMLAIAGGFIAAFFTADGERIDVPQGGTKTGAPSATASERPSSADPVVILPLQTPENVTPDVRVGTSAVITPATTQSAPASPSGAPSPTPTPTLSSTATSTPVPSSSASSSPTAQPSTTTSGSPTELSEEDAASATP
jgi:hypothetical protein